MRYPLYIFSFNTKNFKISKLFSFGIIYILVGLILFELLIRFLIPDGHYPSGHWRNNELRVQTSQLESLEDVDIMFTGSSLCAANIPPKEFDEEMRKGGVNITSFNAGIRGCDYEGVAEGFKKLFWSRKHSGYVVLVVHPHDLHETHRSVRARTQSFIETFNTPYYMAAFLDFFSQSFWTFGFRNEIGEYIKTRNWVYEEPKVGVRGYIPMTQTKPKVSGMSGIEVTINRNGTCAQSLFNLVNWLVKQGVRVIIIEALMHSLDKKAMNPGELVKFRNILKALDGIENVRLLNVNDIIPNDRYFIDAGHLGPEGAKVYGRNLANKFLEVGFPW